MKAHAPAGLAQTEMVRARTIAEACRLLGQAKRAGKRAVLLAGGTDLIVDRHLLPVDRAEIIDLVVDTTGIEELRQIREHEVAGERRLALGGGVTYWHLRTDPRVRKTVPMLEAMARDVGAVQIQTRGTLAGNIATASPAADGVPALLALEGVVRLVSESGERRVMLEDFFVGYRKTVLGLDEVIAEIDVRVPSPTARAGWRKVGTRQAQAISKVALASVLEFGDEKEIARARFAIASCSATPRTLKGVRGAVEGKVPGALIRRDVEAAIDREIQPIDDVRSTAEYRLHVAKSLVWRALCG